MFSQGVIVGTGQKLTRMQQKILQYIEEEIATRGRAPTLRDICSAFQFKAVGTAQSHIQALLQKGYLEKESGRARGIHLSRQYHAESFSIPVLGDVAAGSPREAVEITLGALPVPGFLHTRGELFALRVRGESMVEAGIFDGDLVIARQQNDAQDGEIVVAVVEGEATVKRLEKRKNRVRLMPANKLYPPVEIDTPHSQIQGKVISVQRFYEKSPF